MQKALVLLCCFISLLCSAQQTNEVPQGEDDLTSPLRELGSEYHNSIKLLQNRFRIDYKVDEITMVFFRKYGSIPVVLVRPDGSKIFQSGADGESVFWYDTATYDMISIKNPMRGPWQAVGQILPDSRVMVLSDLELHAEPLPEVLFSGEILKQTAYLTNGGEPIDYSEFRDVVQLSMQFYSTNNPDNTNFGADMQTVATFEDNGKGLDETPLDGTYTGQFNLAIANGEWKPVFVVTTPMFSREQVNPKLVLLPNPIKIDVALDGGGGGYHKLLVDADREYIDISSLLVDGKIRFPNGDIQNFSVTEPSDKAREHLIVNYEYGIFRVKLTAYGKTVDGRDFILDVPEFTFLSEEPEPEAIAPAAEDGTGTEPDSDSMEGNLPYTGINENQMMQDQQQDSMSTMTLIMMIIGVNVVLLTVGGGLIWFITAKKSIKASKKSPADESLNQTSSKLSVVKRKVTGLLKRKGKDNDSGILDLSMPEE